MITNSQRKLVSLESATQLRTFMVTIQIEDSQWIEVVKARDTLRAIDKMRVLYEPDRVTIVNVQVANI